MDEALRTMLRKTCEEDMSTRGKVGNPGRGPGNMGGAPEGGNGGIPAAVAAMGTVVGVPTFFPVSLTDEKVVVGVGISRKGTELCFKPARPPRG